MDPIQLRKRLEKGCKKGNIDIHIKHLTPLYKETKDLSSDDKKYFEKCMSFRKTALALLLDIGSYSSAPGVYYIFSGGVFMKDVNHDILKGYLNIVAKIFDYDLTLVDVATIVMRFDIEHTGDMYSKKFGDIIVHDFVPFANCIFDLKKKKMVQVSNSHLYWPIRRRYHVRYDPAATCPKFIKLLESSLEGDYEGQARVLDMLTLCLMSDKHGVERACFLIGDGDNGKSIITDTFQNMLGADNYGAGTLNDLNDKHQLDMIAGRTCNIKGEDESNEFKSSNLWKSLLSGSTVQVNAKYGKVQKFRSWITFLSSVNKVPRINDKAGGMLKRIERVDFNKQFNPETKWPKTIETDEKEMSGIVNLLLPRMIAMCEKQKIECPSAREYIQEMFDAATDSVSVFARDCLVSDTNSMVKKSDMYSSYKSYCHANKLYVVTKKSFGTHMKSDYADSVYDNARVWIGVKLNPDYVMCDPASKDQVDSKKDTDEKPHEPVTTFRSSDGSVVSHTPPISKADAIPKADGTVVSDTPSIPKADGTVVSDTPSIPKADGSGKVKLKKKIVYIDDEYIAKLSKRKTPRIL